MNESDESDDTRDKPRNYPRGKMETGHYNALAAVVKAELIRMGSEHINKRIAVIARLSAGAGKPRNARFLICSGILLSAVASTRGQDQSWLEDVNNNYSRHTMYSAINHIIMGCCDELGISDYRRLP